MSRWFPRVGLFLALVGVGGCAPPQAVDRAVSSGGAGGSPGSGGGEPTGDGAGSGGAGVAGGSAGSGGSTSPPDALASVDTAPARPDFAPITAASCTDSQPWKAGTEYEAGDTVVHGQPGRKFECRPWPNTPWCWLPEYEPGQQLHYEDAWIDLGRCP